MKNETLENKILQNRIEMRHNEEPASIMDKESWKRKFRIYNLR